MASKFFKTMALAGICFLTVTTSALAGSTVDGLDGDGSKAQLGVVVLEDFHVSGDVAQVPEPSTMLLLGSGLIGLVTFTRRKFRE